jgi:hypothetical protein
MALGSGCLWPVLSESGCSDNRPDSVSRSCADGPERRLQITAHRVVFKPLAIHAKPEESPQRSEALCLGACTEFQAAIEPVHISGSELIQRDVAAPTRRTPEAA